MSIIIIITIIKTIYELKRYLKILFLKALRFPVSNIFSYTIVQGKGLDLWEDSPRIKFIEYPPGKRCLKRQVMSARTNYFTDIGTNCHIQLCVVSGLEETLPDCLQQVVLYSVSLLIPTSFSFSVFYFVRHFRLSHLKQFLLRHSPSI